MNFKQFLAESEEEEKNVQAMLDKLPKSHRDLVKDFKFRYAPGNTLAGDDAHIGVIHKDTIMVAGPWNYGREFTTLHEVGHMVYEKLLTPELKKEWAKIANKNPRQNQDDAEENFCMAYANYYTKHKIVTHTHPTWLDFIKNKVPS